MSKYLIIDEFGTIWKTDDVNLAEAFVDAGAYLVIPLEHLDQVEEVPFDVAAYMLEEDCPDTIDPEVDEED